MKISTYKQRSTAIIYDADRLGSPKQDYFSVEYWRSQQLLTGQAVGRGSAWFINASFGSVVLRQYLRGGWVSRVSKQKYLYLSDSSSRPFKEFRLLNALFQQGLPVPEPVAALIEHRGLLSNGALLTVRIPTVQTLADMLHDDSISSANNLWERVGQCIRKFHDAGVWHADLNARNILVDVDQQIYIIDFDRARFTPGKTINGKANLKRLKRSLIKLWPQRDLDGLSPAWDQLETGYRE